MLADGWVEVSHVKEAQERVNSICKGKDFTLTLHKDIVFATDASFCIIEQKSFPPYFTWAAKTLHVISKAIDTAGILIIVVL